MIDTWLVLGHAAATGLLAGLIVCVQGVHYPLLARVGEASFAAYEREHVRRIGPIVGPLMLVELVTAIALLVRPIEPRWLVWSGLGLLAVIWLSTVLLQMPCHRALERGRDEAMIRRLVLSNWIRTVAWLLRATMALWLVASR